MNIALSSYRLKNKVFSYLAPTWIAKQALKRFLSPRRTPLKEWEQKAEINGQRFVLTPQISAMRWQTTSSIEAQPTKTLLLVHGWESRATQMYGLVPQLITLGYQVIAVDMPAHGQSAGTMSNAEVFIQTILLAQTKIGKFDAIIGHSMGAAATSMALSRGLDTDKLVLVSGPSSLENVFNRFSAFIGLNKKATNKMIDFASELVGTEITDLDACSLLNKNATSTLIIHDQDDTEVPISESRRLLPAFENAELFETKGLGHRKILKSSILNEKITNFLTESAIETEALAMQSQAAR